MSRLRTGGLAIFKQCPNEPANVGLVVTLVKRGARDTKGFWLVEGAIKHGPQKRAVRDEIPRLRAWALRAWLAPIDASDDAQDETLQWLPSPSKEAA